MGLGITTGIKVIIVKALEYSSGNTGLYVEKCKTPRFEVYFNYIETFE